MSYQPPPDPRSSSRRSPLGFDDAIGIVVAFGAIGAILWWGLSRGGSNGIRLGEWNLFPASSQSTGLGLQPEPTATPTIGDLFLSPTPAPSPAPRTAASDRSTIAPETPETIGPPPPRTVVIAPAPVPFVVRGSAPSPAPSVASPTPTASASAPSEATASAPALNVPSASPGTAVQFADIPAGYWALPFIVPLAQRGIIKGFPNGTFQPDRPLTRAEYASLIQTIFTKEAQSSIAFKDVPANSPTAPAIDTAVKTGFLKGYPEGVFQPDQPITRAQALASLVNGLNLPPAANPNEVVQLFQDSDRIPDWAVPAVAAATRAGLVVNYPQRDQLNPNQPVTRAEMSALLYQGLATANQLPSVDSNYIVRP